MCHKMVVLKAEACGSDAQGCDEGVERFFVERVQEFRFERSELGVCVLRKSDSSATKARPFDAGCCNDKTNRFFAPWQQAQMTGEVHLQDIRSFSILKN